MSSSFPVTPGRRRSSDSISGAFFMVATVLLGLAVGIGAIFSVLMWADAHGAREQAAPAAMSTAAEESPRASGMDGMDMGATATGGALTSYAGAAPEDAEALAAAHTPFPADLPAVAPGPVANVKLALTDITIDVAPG